MPELSERAGLMPASPIRKLVPYADAAKARGIEVLHLNIGQPDLEAPEQFWDGIRGTIGKVVEYTHSAGTAGLRKATIELYKAKGIDLKEGQLMVTTAGSEAVNFALMACCNPGDEVIVPEPFYANYLGFATGIGVKIVPITTYVDQDFRLPSAEEFAAKITPRTKAIMICNPSNPTGTIYDRSQLLALRDVVLEHNLFLIADEVYREFNYTASEVPSVLQLEGLEQHAIMCDSVSKRYSLCGARIGFLCSRNADLMDAALRMGQARLSPPAIEQAGVEAASTTPQAYFDAMREEYRHRRDTLVSRLQKMPGVVVPQIDGAFYATVRLPIDDSDKFCQWLLEHFSLNGKTVMMAPGTGFYATPGLGRDEVRMAYVLKAEKIELAMDCLEAALTQYNS